VALFTSKRNQPGEAVHPQDSTAQKNASALKDATLVSDVIPTPPNASKANGSKKHTPLWEKLAVVIAFGLLIVNICQMRSTEKAAKAAETANKNAQTALAITEQANVTIGRQDGIVADIVWPKDPKGNAGILMYFQNSGHLPAKFNWGSESSISEVLPTDPKILKESEMQHTQWTPFYSGHAFDPMWRAKRKKTGGLGWSGTILIPGNSSYQGILWDIPKIRMLQLMRWDRPFVPEGKFEYCDGFGHHLCRTFRLLYRQDPYNRFLLSGEDDCAVYEMQPLHPDPDWDYLSPCELSENREELQRSFSRLPKP